MLVYLTADSIGAKTGGGRVTREEVTALQTLGAVKAINPRPDLADPFLQDEHCLTTLQALVKHSDHSPRLCHVYAGCFNRSVAYLKEIGYKVTYTVAAHDVDRSRNAHIELGLPFPYPHLNDPELFKRYSAAYVSLADVVIVPGKAPLEVVRKQGRTRAVEVIPHGCDFPEDMPDPPPQELLPFTIGYLGAVGPDKGLLTLARAFKSVRDGLAGPGFQGRLLLGGRYSLSALPLFKHVCGMDAPVFATGWLDNVTDFYKRCNLYVQPSNTEGFGIEVLEAMAHGVPTLCSDQAGAADLVQPEFRFPAGDHARLANRLHVCHAWRNDLRQPFVRTRLRNAAYNWRWESVRESYVRLWKGLLNAQSKLAA
jgi:glycosyltransferase involved in cell wall biosynthesis